MLKKLFFFATIFTLLFTSFIFSQSASNSITGPTVQKVYSDGYLIGCYVRFTFTADSLGTDFYSPAFEIPEFDGVDWNTDKVTCRIKEVSTAGRMNSMIRLLGCFSSVADTLVLDTLRTTDAKQTESDSLFNLSIVGSDGTRSYRAPNGYRISIRNKTNDVNSGVLDFFFPKPESVIRKGGY